MRNSKTALSRLAKGCFFFFAFLFFSSGLFAQQAVKGRLSDVAGAPLSGVSVVIKGTTRGTTTNANGEFSLSANPGDVIEFSMIGFQTTTVKVAANTGDINLQLQ